MFIPKLHTALLTFVVVLAATRMVAAAEPRGEYLLTDGGTAAKLVGASAATQSLIDVNGQAFTTAVAVDVHRKTGTEYAVQLTQPLPTAIAAGDVLLASVWARLVETPDESNEARFGLVLESGKGPLVRRVFGVGQAWQRFDVPFVVAEAHETGTVRLNLRLGYYVQSLQLGGLSVRRFPAGTPLSSLPETRPTYAGRAADAPWRREAAERIDTLRKGALTVEVVDAAGRPVPDAVVRVRMMRHAFTFGSVYNANLVAGPDAATPAAVAYRKKFLELFNTGVDELMQKWPWWDNPKHRKSAIDSVAWMREHNVDVRGHVMVWPSWRKTPASLKALANEPEKLRRRVADHIADIGRAFKGQFTEWDVVNEPIVNNDLLKILGEDVMAEWFRLARQADPDARLYLNEAGVPNSIPGDVKYDKFYRHIELIRNAGAPIGGIGMQGHFGWTMNSPTQLLSIYDRFSKFGLPIRLTELDIEVSDPDLQYDYMRDVLTATFSHPNVNGIVNWSFWAGASWKPKAALFDEAWQPTAAGRAWTDLINRDWWTDIQGKTGLTGTFACRGFLGSYQIDVQVHGKMKTVAMKLSNGVQTVRVEVDRMGSS